MFSVRPSVHCPSVNTYYRQSLCSVSDSELDADDILKVRGQSHADTTTKRILFYNVGLEF